MKIFTTFKETDTNYYFADLSMKNSAGYPLGLQYEQTIYSWGSEEYKDILFIRTDVINMSDDTLFDCWFAPLFNTDITTRNNFGYGAANDRCDYYRWEDSLNLAYTWTNGDAGETNKGFGYAGFFLLNSPAVKKCEKLIQTEVDGVWGVYCWQCTQSELVNGVEVCTDSIIFKQNEDGFLRNDKIKYLRKEQIGLTTFRNWPVEMDFNTDTERYNAISSKYKDGDNGPQDLRILFSTGPFHMAPGDRTSVWMGIAFAKPAVNDDADGSYEDLGMADTLIKNSLVDKVFRSRKLWENNILVGVEDNEQPSGGNPTCSVFPNPASDYAVIELNTIPDGAVKYELYNATGEKQLSGEATASNRFSVNTSGLPAGCYVLKVFDGTRCLMTKLNVVH